MEFIGSSNTHTAIFLLFFHIHAVSRTQMGRQGEKYCVPHFKLNSGGVVNSGYQRLASPRHQNEERKILNISFPQFELFM